MQNENLLEGHVEIEFSFRIEPFEHVYHEVYAGIDVLVYTYIAVPYIELLSCMRSNLNSLTNMYCPTFHS
jgi:hypothetical protein